MLHLPKNGRFGTAETAAVVYPVAVAGPAVLMVPIGALIYRQPMGKYGLIGALLGICSILAIALG